MKALLVLAAIFLALAGGAVPAVPLGRIEAAQWKPAAEADLAERLAAAPTLEFEELAPGGLTTWVESPRWVLNPDGKTWDAWILYSRAYMGPHKAVIVDFGRGTVRQQDVSSGQGRDPEQSNPFMFHLVPEYRIRGKMYYLPMGGGGRISVWRYDPGADRLDLVGFPDTGDIRRGAWSVGEDGFIYSVGLVAAEEGKRFAAYRLDLDTFKAETSEPFGPANPNLGFLYAKQILDGDWIYCAAGTTPWRLVGYNFRTKEWRLLAETERITGDHTTLALRKSEGAVWVDVKQIKGGGPASFVLKDGVLTERKAEATGRRGRVARPDDAEPPKPELGGTRPDSEGRVALWYRNPGTPKDGPLQGWRKVEYSVPLYPDTMNLIQTLEDGRVMAFAGGYGEAALFDPTTGKATRLGKQVGSVYSVTTLNGKVYTGAYAGTKVAEIDPSRPWTPAAGSSMDTPPTPASKGGAKNEEEDVDADLNAAAGANPRLLAVLKEETSVHIPMAAAAGGDGRLYFGGKEIRTGDGGGFGWCRPPAEGRPVEKGGVKLPAYQVFYMCAAGQGRYILISTKPGVPGDNPAERPKQGRLFIWDAREMKMKHELDLPFGNPGPVCEVFDGLVMGHGYGGEGAGKSVLYGLDPERGEVLWTKEVPEKPVTAFSAVRRHSWHFGLGPDGKVWTFFGKTLARIEPASAQIEAVGVIPQRTAAMLAFSGGKVFVAGGDHFRTLKGVTYRP